MYKEIAVDYESRRTQAVSGPVQERNFGLDLLRSISILFVLFHHTYFIPKQFGKVGYFFIGNGTMGVEIFFVLSGFLIFGILYKLVDRNESFYIWDLRTFLIRRWYRTLPNYYFVLIISIAIFSATGFKSEINYSRYFLFTQTFFGYRGNFFAPSWSLAAEEFSYILAAVLTVLSIYIYRWIAQKTPLRTIVVRSLIFSLVIIKAINYLVLSNTTTSGDWNSMVRYATFYRFDSILVGGILAYSFSYYRDSFLRWKLVKLLLGISIILMATLLQKKMIIIKDYHNYPFLSISILPLMAAGIAFLFPFFYSLKCRNAMILFIVYWISVLSYSLYLCNSQIVELWQMFNFTNDWLAYVILWISFFIVSIILYKFIEQPFMKLRNKNFKQ